MHINTYPRTLLLILIFSLFGPALMAGEARIAVASNFSDAMRELAKSYQAHTGNTVTLIFGSTGKHFAQVVHGAPFDAFFAADIKRPRLLEQQGYTVPSSRFTYAIGQIVLWSPKQKLVDNQGQILKSDNFRYLAIANPKLAPYGKAGQQVLQSHQLWRKLQGQLVRGENIGQTYQFVKSGNAELGFVAYSQIIKHSGGSYWRVPQSLYNPIQQQAVLLKDNPVAADFLLYVKSDAGQQIIRDFGYEVADVK
ncbi:MAG: molybdate ABC transporter substrate-binding protein [Gammaproteobacteria bacterium]|nr:molybdate ABC transporter substrate-binding protein [Gammaproteobacteria bacterium]